MAVLIKEKLIQYVPSLGLDVAEVGLLLLADRLIIILNGVVLDGLEGDGNGADDTQEDEDNGDDDLTHTLTLGVEGVVTIRRTVTNDRGLDNWSQDTSQVLDELVETGEASSLVGVVGEGSHQPVRVTLVHGIENTIEEVQEEGSNVLAGVVDKIDAVEISSVLDPGILCGVENSILGSEGGLEDDTSDPDGNADTSQHNQAIASTGGAVPLRAIQEVAVEDGGDDLSEPVEHGVHVTGALGEVEAVDSVELVRVDPVGGEEHGNESQHAPVLEESEDRLELGDGARVLDLDDMRAISTDDLVGGQQENRDEGSEGHDNHVSDVRGSGSTTGLVVAPLNAERNDVTEDTTAVEDGPEDGEVLALLVLSGVTHHDGTLSAPQPTSTNTEQAGGDDNEGDRVNVVVGQERSDVEDIGQATENEKEAVSNNVEESAGEQGREGEHAGESSTGSVTDIRILGTKTVGTGSVQGIEHTRAAEADETQDDDLGQRIGESHCWRERG